MHGKRFFRLACAVAAIMSTVGHLSLSAAPAADCGCSQTVSPPMPAQAAHARRQASASLRSLPLQFEPNVGQAASPVQFLARGGGYSLLLTGREALLTLHQKASANAAARTATVRMSLAGASNPSPRVAGTQPMRGRINYLLGRDPKQWHTNIPTFRSVRYSQVYPGIDLLYYGSHGRLEYDFVVAPGHSPQAIRFALHGSGSTRLTAHGDLHMPISGGDLGWNRPVAYQAINGRHLPVAARFAMRPDHTVGFAVGKYDTRRPLVIDPALLYSTYLGSAGEDYAYAIATDSNGMAYLTGDVTDALPPASQFPGTQNGVQTASGGGADAFVAKIDTTSGGTASLVYATYLGGAGDDRARSIAVDSSFSAYVVGFTSSADFPTSSALDGAFGGPNTGASSDTDAFIAKLSPDGSSFSYATYLGGAGNDAAYGVAVDSADEAYVVGATSSDQTSFNPQPQLTAFQATQQGGADGFLVQLDAAGGSALYSTFIGGTGDDFAFAIALSPPNLTGTLAYITGKTLSTDLPVTANAYQSASAGTGQQAFVLAIDPTQPILAAASYFSYLGGNGDNFGNAIAFGTDGYLYVAGTTNASDFPTFNAEQPTFGGGNSDAFLAEIDPAAVTGSASLLYSTYLGGSGDDYGTGLLLQPGSNGLVASITGYTNSINQADATPPGQNNEFTPVGSGSAFQNDNGGQGTGQGTGTFDAFLAQIDPALAGTAALTYLSYIGGTDDELDQDAVDPVTGNPGFGGPGCAIAADALGNLFVTGSTLSQDFMPFPTTIVDGAEAYQSNNAGGVDAFLIKLTFKTTLADQDAVSLPAMTCGGTTVTGNVSLNGPAPSGGAVVNLSVDNPKVGRIINPATGQPTSQIIIPAGQTSAPFQLSSLSVAAEVNLTVKATYLGAAKTGFILIEAPSLKALQLNGLPSDTNPAMPSAGGGSTVTGTVLLTCPAGTGGKVIYLRSSNTSLANVPGYVQVLPGDTQIQFTFTAGAVTSSTPVTISASPVASQPGISVILTITPQGTVPPSLKLVLSTPTTTVGPNTDVKITLSLIDTSDTPTGPGSDLAGFDTNIGIDTTYLAVGSGFTIDPGSPFTFNDAPNASTSSNLRVAYDPDTGPDANATSGAPIVLGSFVVHVGANGVPATGTVITLGAASVSPNAGGSEVINGTTFTNVLTGVTPVTLTSTGTTGGGAAPIQVSAFSVTPTTVFGGSLVTASVTLSAPAASGGTTVTLTSSDPSAVPLPAQIVIPAGKQTLDFVVLTKGVPQTVITTLTAATAAAPAQTASLTVLGATVQSLTLNPSTVPGGGISTATIALNATAPKGGAVVSVSSTANGVANVPSPATVTVPEGATQITFPVQSHPVTATQSVSISASYNNSSAAGTLTVMPAVGGNIASGLQMFSVPYDYPSASLDSLFGYSNVTLAVYAPSMVSDPLHMPYAITPAAPADHIRLGRAYWARLPNAVSLQQIGTPADTTKDFTITLDAGWNMIGDPFLSSVSISSLLVQTGEFPVTFAAATNGSASLVYGTLFRYPGGDGKGYVAVGAADSLQPGIGYWLYAFGRTTLIVPHP